MTEVSHKETVSHKEEVKKPAVSEFEIDAALEELLHERSQQGDKGCFGCGSSVHWGQTQIDSRIPFYREMLKRIIEAVKGAHAPVAAKPAATPHAHPAQPPAHTPAHPSPSHDEAHASPRRRSGHDAT